MPLARRIHPADLLRFACVAVVALVFAVAGVQKLRADPGAMTMLTRYIDAPAAVRALGCIELGLALWLLSFKTPRLGAGVALAMLMGFTVLIALELNRSAPLPCGCLEIRPGGEPFAVRSGLWASVARNGVLMLLATLSIALAPRQTPHPR